MALETLKGVKKIGRYEVLQERPENEEGMVNWKLFDEMRKTKPIFVDHDVNMISFRIQNGPIKENGVNGCDVDTIIAAAECIIHGLNKKFPCVENEEVLSHLSQARYWLNIRKADREKRGVEGQSLI